MSALPPNSCPFRVINYFFAGNTWRHAWCALPRLQLHSDKLVIAWFGSHTNQDVTPTLWDPIQFIRWGGVCVTLALDCIRNWPWSIMYIKGHRRLLSAASSSTANSTSLWDKMWRSVSFLHQLLRGWTIATLCSPFNYSVQSRYGSGFRFLEPRFNIYAHGFCYFLAFTWPSLNAVN